MKLYDASNITLDGQMNEAVWANVPEFTDFRLLEAQGGQLAESQTFFKILPCKDRVYFGIKCMELDMERVRTQPKTNAYHSSSVELFLSPCGNAHEFYHFILSFAGISDAGFFTEDGNARPEKHFAPEWNFAVYDGGGYWSAEVELPLKAFYMSVHENWSETWRVNVARNYFNSMGRQINSTWCPLKKRFIEPENFAVIGGFPVRPRCDDLRMKDASAVIDYCADGLYCGTLTFDVTTAVAAEFEFTSDCADTVNIALEPGDNTITVPYHNSALGRQMLYLQLKRLSDGAVFKRFSIVQTDYEPIRLRLTLPEYRGNFYPGQDYTKVVGTVTATKPVTVKLEGPGIETQVVTPGEDGIFTFETPNFELGEACLTATIDGWEVKRKIRRLAETGHTMTWIENGHLVVNGKPVIARNVYAPRYRVSVVDLIKYDADNLYETREMAGRDIKPWTAYPEIKKNGMGEFYWGGIPSQKVFDWMEAEIESFKDADFGYWELCDEPGHGGTSYLQQLYEFVAEKDPYHVVQVNTHFPAKWIDCCDIVSTHPYISPRNAEGGRIHAGVTIDKMGAYIDQINNLNRPDKCISFSPTCFSRSPGLNGCTDWDYPTLDEFICNSWAALNCGADKLYPYAGHDLHDRAALYEGVRYVFSSVEALEDFLLYGERTVLMRTDKVEAVMWELGDKKMFTLLNFTLETQTVTVDNLTGTWYNFRNGGTISGNTFELKPMELIIGTSDVRDAGLPTYAETAALIDKKENERIQNGGLLFNHYKEIGITTSTGTNGRGYKLFDGVRDNFAWSQKSDEEKFIELNLTKLKPQFNKVFVGGWHIEDAELKLRVGDELIAAPVAEVLTEEFSTTYILKEAVCPDALRLEFHQEYVELYEIDVFKDVE